MSVIRYLEEDRGPNMPPKRIPIVRCECNLFNIECYDFTNTCDHCGADYNFAGQRLAPREQWGEETGEHWSECV
jgi:hypothetical protein